MSNDQDSDPELEAVDIGELATARLAAPAELEQARMLQISRHQAAITRLEEGQEALEQYASVLESRYVGSAPDIQDRLEQRVAAAWCLWHGFDLLRRQHEKAIAALRRQEDQEPSR